MLPGPRWEGGHCQNCTKTFLGREGMCVENFVKECGFPLALHILTDKQTCVRVGPFINVEIFIGFTSLV